MSLLIGDYPPVSHEPDKALLWMNDAEFIYINVCLLQGFTSGLLGCFAVIGMYPLQKLLVGDGFTVVTRNRCHLRYGKHTFVLYYIPCPQTDLACCLGKLNVFSLQLFGALALGDVAADFQECQGASIFRTHQYKAGLNCYLATIAADLSQLSLPFAIEHQFI